MKLAQPSPIWPGLEVILVPHGLQAAQVNIVGGPGDEPLLFRLPAQFDVERGNASPGKPPMPSIVGLGYQPCAGGGGGGQVRDDCGRRVFSANVAITLSGVTVLLPQVESGGSPDPSSLYERCSAPDPLPGLFARSEGTVSGGTVPVAALLDPTVDKIDVSGSATYTMTRAGSLITRQYDWLLILCRIRDGVPAC